MTTEQLRRYITQHMRMSYVYQPVMLRELLRSDGKPASNRSLRFSQQDNQMRSLVMTDKDAREQATRYCFKREQRQAREE